MIADVETVEKRTNPYAKQLVVIGTVVAIPVLLVYFIPSLHAYRIPMAFLMLIYLIYSIGLAAIMYRMAPSPLPLMPLVIGLIIAVGGAALYGISTVINTPTSDLAMIFSVAIQIAGGAPHFLDTQQPTDMKCYDHCD